MRHALAALLALVFASPVLAQTGARGLGSPAPRIARERSVVPALPGLAQRLGSPLPSAPEPAGSPRGPERERPWSGPQVQLGYAYYRLADGYGGGDVHAADLEVFVQLPISELRMGVLGEIGAHGYSLGATDLLARGGVELGFQLPGLFDPFVPYVSFVGSVGGVFGKRFETTVADLFGGAGVALGAELRAYRNLHLGVQGSYQRMEMHGASYDVFMLRLYAGL